MERNEVQGICVAYNSSHAFAVLPRRPAINILLQAALEPDPRIKDVPAGLALRAARRRTARRCELFFARAAVGRPFVAPPGMPADRLAALREAFDATMTDPAFLAEAKAQNLNVVPITAQQMTDIIASGLQDAARRGAADHQGAGTVTIRTSNRHPA